MQAILRQAKTLIHNLGVLAARQALAQSPPLHPSRQSSDAIEHSRKPHEKPVQQPTRYPEEYQGGCGRDWQSHVAKGINFYSLEKRSPLGQVLAHEVRPRRI